MKYTGTLEIFRVGPFFPTDTAQYVVTYAPESAEAEAGETLRPGALEALQARLRQRVFSGEEALTGWLGEIGIPQDTINRVVKELRFPGRTRISSVVLSDEQLTDYGLQWTIGTKILSYLSALTR
jgi:hypothetical protein